MGDYMNFRYALKDVFRFCGSDEHLVYTPFYKFENPNCHRVQGGLRLGGGQITSVLILFPDLDDKQLVWPARLQFKLLAYKKGKTKLLGTEEMKWELKDVEKFSEDIQWKYSINCSLEDLRKKDMIGQDDSLTFIWSVKLYFPQPQGFNLATSSMTTSSREKTRSEMESEAKERFVKDQEHKLEQEADFVPDSQSVSSVALSTVHEKDLDDDAGQFPETENLIKEIIRLYSIDMAANVLNLKIAVEKEEVPHADFPDATESESDANGQCDTQRAADSKLEEPKSKNEKRSKELSQSLLSISKDNNPVISTKKPVEVDAETVMELLESGRKQNEEKQRILTPLMRYSLSGDIDKIKTEEFSDINMQGPWEMTPLLYASWNGNKEIVQILIENGADVNAANYVGMSALMAAVMRGHDEILQLLVRNGANVDVVSQLKFIQAGPSSIPNTIPTEYIQDVVGLQSCKLTCLIVAAALNHQSTVKLLLGHPADVNAETDNEMSALKAACLKGHSAIVRLLLENDACVHSQEKVGVTPLMLASTTDNVDIINMLLEKGADVNTRSAHGTTALMVAAHSGTSKVVKALLDNKADVDEQDISEHTSLMFASAGGHFDVVKCLLSYRANYASPHQDDTDKVIVLLDNGTDVNKCDKYGKTALMYASIKGNVDIIELLLKSGANIHASDNQGNSSLTLASENNNFLAVQCLLRRSPHLYSSSTLSLSDALVKASSKGHSDIVRLLLENGALEIGANIERLAPLTEASRYCHLNVVKQLLKNESKLKVRDKYNAILMAHNNGHTELLSVLLDGLTIDETQKPIPSKDSCYLSTGEPCVHSDSIDSGTSDLSETSRGPSPGPGLTASVVESIIVDYSSPDSDTQGFNPIKELPRAESPFSKMMRSAYKSSDRTDTQLATSVSAAPIGSTASVTEPIMKDFSSTFTDSNIPAALNIKETPGDESWFKKKYRSGYAEGSDVKELWSANPPAASATNTERVEDIWVPGNVFHKDIRDPPLVKV